MPTLIFSANALEQKRIARAVAANLRLERLLALRHAQEQNFRCTPVSTEQGSSVLQFVAADVTATQLHAAALEAGTESSRIQLLAYQLVQQGRLP